MLKMFACLWICMALCIAVSSGQNCDTGLMTEVQNCYTSQGLTFKVQTNQTIDTILKQATDLNPSVQCADVNKYKNVMSCLMTPLKTCLMPMGLSGLLPDIQLLSNGFDYFCSNVNSFDFDCVVARSQDMKQCAMTATQEFYGRYPEASKMTATQIVCLSYDITYECISLNLASCPKNTAQIYLNLVDNYLLPSACLNEKPSNTDRQAYLYSDARGHHSEHYYQYIFILVGVFFLLL